MFANNLTPSNPNINIHKPNNTLSSLKSGQMSNQLVSIKNRNDFFSSEIPSQKKEQMKFISQELNRLVDAPKFWEEIKRIGSSLSKEQMENIQNEFQNAIKTEQFDDKTIQDLYKRTNKMFKEDSILRSYFPVYSKQKIKPLMHALNNLKTLATPTKDSKFWKIVGQILTIVNGGAGKTSGMTTSSTQGSALEGFLGTATIMAFNGLEEHHARVKENLRRDKQTELQKQNELAQKYKHRAYLREERTEQIASFSASSAQRYQYKTNERKQIELENAIEVRSTQEPGNGSIPADSLINETESGSSNRLLNDSKLLSDSTSQSLISNFIKTRSFIKMQKSIRTFCNEKSTDNYKKMLNRISEWKLSKRDNLSNKNWACTTRYNYISKLDNWIIDEGCQLGVYPKKNKGYGENHNCYAYAMKCLKPEGLGLNSTPGLFSGTSKKMGFAEAVIEDGKKQRKDVHLISKNINDLPKKTNDGTYLVALFANDFGYHFMRRDEPTGLWSHKNGAFSEEEVSFYEIELEKPIPICNNLFLNIARDPSKIGCNMQFSAYLEVPDDGLQVQGVSEAKLLH
ncbi:hypothetical protein [Candidatus Hamiltonella defensa]|nr:hypothetical protein [Candidatus Hamiltonella defensa]ATW32082.1 hypothetical protein BJP42_07065 [Candidatus Hamiltonella defensa]